MDHQELNFHRYALERKHRQEMTKQTNEAAIEFSKRTLTSLFLLNGATATALLAKGGAYITPAVWLAFGAFFAVVAFAVSYLYILLLLQTWDLDQPETNEEKYYTIERFKLSYNDIERLRLIPISFAVISFVLFVVGIIKCATMS